MKNYGNMKNYLKMEENNKNISINMFIIAFLCITVFIIVPCKIKNFMTKCNG